MAEDFVILSIDREGGFSMSDESVPENKPAADKGSAESNFTKT